MVESTPNFPGLIVRRQRIMGLGFGLLILVFGVIIGAGGTFLYFKDRFVPPPQFSLDRIRGMVQEMHDKLALTEQQEKQIHALFEERFKAMGEFFKGVGEKQKQEWDLTLSSMKNILTEEQFAKWKTDMDERRQRWDHERNSRGQQGPGRGGPEGQRGQGGPGGPDRGDGRRDRPNQGDRPQQGPPPGGPMPSPDQPGQPTPPPPGTPTPDQAPKPAEPAAPTPGSTPPKTPEQPKPL